MRMFLVTALVATVTGCTCTGPQIDPKATVFNVDTVPRRTRPAIATRIIPPPESGKRVKYVKRRVKKTAHRKTEAARSVRLNDKTDSVTEKAKTDSVTDKTKTDSATEKAKPTIAATTQSAPSAESGEKVRSISKSAREGTAKMEASPSAQPNDRTDSATEKAKTDSATEKAKPTIAATTQSAPVAQSDRKAHSITKSAKDGAAKMGALPSAQPNGKTESVTEKAKATITAKMGHPASVVFGEMKRAVRKNARGEPIDTICGYVKGKSVSGGDTGEMPFLYLVKEDEAYIVNWSGDDVVAATAYRTICD